MKKSIAVMMILLLIVGVVAGCSPSGSNTSSSSSDSNASSSEKEKLVVGLDDQFPPMGYRDEAGELVGFDIDLAKEVGVRLGMEVVLQPINWSNKELELDGGNVDLLWNGLTITPSRQEAMLITQPYLRNAQVIVVGIDSDIATKADLAGKTVGLQNGSSADDAFENPENGVADIVDSKVGFDDNVMALGDLELGRIDALVVDKVVADYYLTLKPGLFKILEDELEAEEFGVAFKKDNTELYDKVVGALSDMVADGTAAKISEEWFGENRIIFE